MSTAPPSDRHDPVGHCLDVSRQLLRPILVLLTQASLSPRPTKHDNEQHRGRLRAGLIPTTGTPTLHHQEPSIDTKAAPGNPQSRRPTRWQARESACADQRVMMLLSGADMG